MLLKVLVPVSQVDFLELLHSQAKQKKKKKKKEILHWKRQIGLNSGQAESSQ